MRLTSSVSCLLLGNKSSETGKSCLSTSKDTAADHINSQSSIYLLNQESPVDPPQKTQQLTTSTLDLSFTLSSIGVHPNPPEIWRTLPWRIETRNRKTTMKNTLFFFSKLLFVPIANNFSLYLDITSVICFWPHKIQIHSVYSNVFSSKYKLSIFSYQHNPMVKSCKTAPDSKGS